MHCIFTPTARLKQSLFLRPFQRSGFLVALLLVAASGTSQSAVEQSLQQFLKGQTIRITYGLPEPPFLFVKDGKWEGVLPEFMEHIALQRGFSYQEVPISSEALKKIPSINTACLHDLRRNLTDLCIGNMWAVPARMAMASQFPNWWQETLFLVSMEKEVGFGSHLVRVLRPFRYEVWGVIFAVIFVYAVLNWWVEREDNDKDFPQKGLFPSLMQSVYHGFFSACWSEPSMKPLTAEGKILSDLSGGEVANLKEAVSGGMRVCTFNAVLSRLQVAYPGILELAVDIDSYKDGYKKMDSGECSVLLVAPRFHAEALGGKFSPDAPTQHCKKKIVGKPVAELECTSFARTEYLLPLAHEISNFKTSGYLDKVLAQFPPPDSKCGEADDDEDEADRLRLVDVTGTLVIVGCGMASALVLRLTRCTRQDVDKITRATTSVFSHSSNDRNTTRHSRNSRFSSLDASSPGVALLENFRHDSRLNGMPLERALLLLGESQAAMHKEALQAQAQAQEEVLQVQKEILKAVSSTLPSDSERRTDSRASDREESEEMPLTPRLPVPLTPRLPCQGQASCRKPSANELEAEPSNGLEEEVTV